MEYALLPFRRYFEFRGRSRRKEYWLWTLLTTIVSGVLSIADDALGLSAGGSDNGVLSGLFALGTFIPGLAVLVRRLHDTDRSAWLLLSPIAVAILALVLIPVAGGVGVAVVAVAIAVILGGLLILLCREGTRGPNRFGPDPKDAAGSADLAEVFR